MRPIIRIAETPEAFFRLIRLREEVFVVEQGVPIGIELDDEDDRAIHFIATVKKEVVGTARLIIRRRSGKIGRMAVRKEWRGKSIGTALIGFIIKLSERKRLTVLTLHAQEPAVSFYARLGFVAEGERFYEAGIPHRKMALQTNSRRKSDRMGG